MNSNNNEVPEVVTKSEKETFNFAKSLAKNASTGDIFCLSGQLGAGKTVFAKGFASGLNIHDEITSPTFTIVNEYKNGIIPLFHFDCFRLGGYSEAFCFEFEEYFETDAVCLIEWPENINAVIPSNAVNITIAVLPDNSRKIILDKNFKKQQKD